MKIKIVVKLSMNDEKSRRKALVISVGTSGVESAALTGPERNQVEVVGEGIDAVALTRQLRKNVAHTELVSLAEVKKPEAPPAPAPPKAAVAPTPPPPTQIIWSQAPPQPWNDQFLVQRYDMMMAPAHDPSCIIM